MLNACAGQKGVRGIHTVCAETGTDVIQGPASHTWIALHTIQAMLHGCKSAVCAVFSSILVSLTC
jgi:hypothetical protein